MASVSQVTLGFDRCLCIHTVPQILERLLQYLLYERQLVPFVVAQVLTQSSTSRLRERFISEYTETITSLHEVFRSARKDKIRQVVFMVGPTTYNPNDMYTIEVPMSCDNYICNELSTKETHEVMACLFRQSLAQSFKRLPNHSSYRKFHVMLYAERDSNLYDLGFRNKDNFTLPTTEIIQKRKICHGIINIMHGQNCNGHSDKTKEINCEWYIHTTGITGYCE